MYKLINTNIKEWEIEHSSLYKINHQTNYYECRKYSCEDISKRTFYKRIPMTKNFTIEIPHYQNFHIFGRVNANNGEDSVKSYYEMFEVKNFSSFSTINNTNISRYKGKRFFAYNIFPTDIVHVFPIDSNTMFEAEKEDELNNYPSLWLTLDELETLNYEMGVYNQITCRTKRNGEIIKPFAVVCFDHITTEDKEIAQEFDIGKILVHPQKNCISYDRDLLFDIEKVHTIEKVMQKKYGLNVEYCKYFD